MNIFQAIARGKPLKKGQIFIPPVLAEAMSRLPTAKEMVNAQPMTLKCCCSQIKDSRGIVVALQRIHPCPIHG